MGLVIAIYTKEAFKEYVVPAVNNADYSIVLNKNYFNLRSDISLDFEVINDVWKIKKSDSCRIYLNKNEIQENTVLADSEMFKIVTSDKKQMQTTICEGEECAIKYTYRQLISK